MYIAVDDTDSREGMCTTYLLSEIIIRIGNNVIIRSLVCPEQKVPFNTKACFSYDLRSFIEYTPVMTAGTSLIWMEPGIVWKTMKWTWIAFGTGLNGKASPAS